MNKRRIKEYAVSYSFLLPFAVFFITFTIIPIGYVFYLSLHDGNFLQAQFDWVGLRTLRMCCRHRISKTLLRTRSSIC